MKTLLTWVLWFAVTATWFWAMGERNKELVCIARGGENCE